MRFIATVRLPVEPFNSLVMEGSAGKLIGKILEENKPEHVYFTETNGERSCIMIVNVDDASQIPAISEPWYLSFEADVEYRIAMTPEDLMKSNLEALGNKWK
ncbi:MAG: panthothenate synthetase [Ignavibacteria bacterium]|nr:panthothenate synthetase [Ignavibacteria bacterium]